VGLEDLVNLETPVDQAGPADLVLAGLMAPVDRVLLRLVQDPEGTTLAGREKRTSLAGRAVRLSTTAPTSTMTNRARFPNPPR
jgi:hypothetical protein